MDWCIERLRELREEYAAGEAQLKEVERQRAHVCEQLLRIEGAMRVLEEQLVAMPEFTGDLVAEGTA
jgi:septal ring factor EnvC (AmiA/AmiB activator)